MVFGTLRRSRGIGSNKIIALVSCSILVVFSWFYVPTSLSKLLSNSMLSKVEGDFITVPTNRDKKSLPDFTNGGIIVFYHIYKTGGSTVGKLLHELAKKDQNRFPSQDQKTGTNPYDYETAVSSPSRLFFTMIRKHINWEDDCLTTLDLAENNKKLVLLELHVEHPAPDFPSLVELAPILEKWRAEADRRGVGFFAFTLLREPVAHALSFFNFFHVGNTKPYHPPPTREDHDYWNPFKPLQSTQKNFLRSYYADNRQCQMLNADPESTRGAPKDLVWNESPRSTEDIAASHKPCHVDKVHDALFNSLDWVGTTENMQNETLPLLTQIVANDPSIGRNNVPFKVFDKNPAGKKGMKEFDLSKKTMTAILKRTKLDRGLYAEVVRNFRLKDLGWDYESLVYD